jgi:hypothetical protein
LIAAGHRLSRDYNERVVAISRHAATASSAKGIAAVATAPLEPQEFFTLLNWTSLVK